MVIFPSSDFQRLVSSQAEDVLASQWRIQSRLLRTAYEMDAVVSMLRSLMDVASDIKRRYDQLLDPVIARLSKGFASLSDDLLHIIFRFAVEEEGPFQAVRLSLVSRRFRNLAISDHTLWTSLSYGVSKGELEAFIGRSGPNTFFDASIRVVRPLTLEKPSTGAEPVFEPAFNVFLETCWPSMSRWKSMSLTLAESGSYRHLEYALRAFNRHNGACLSSLEEIRIHSEEQAACIGPVDLTWMAPNLRLLQTSNIVPPYVIGTTHAFSTITTFKCTIGLAVFQPHKQAELFVEFVDSLPNLATLELELKMEQIGAISFRLRTFPVLPLSSKHSITNFTLTISHFTFGCDASWAVYFAELLLGLNMTRLENLTICMDVIGIDATKAECDSFLNALSIALLPPHHHDDARSRVVCPNLSTLNFHLRYDPAKDEDDEGSRAPDSEALAFPEQIAFPIPLGLLPTVTTVNITTFTRVLFTRGTEALEDGDITGSPCGLREIRFEGSNNTEISDLRMTIQSLKDVDAWETIERFVVENTNSLQLSEVLDEVGEGRLRYTS